MRKYIYGTVKNLFSRRRSEARKVIATGEIQFPTDDGKGWRKGLHEYSYSFKPNLKKA